MAKYNITEKSEKAKKAAYRNAITPAFVEEVARKLITKLMVEQKYRDPNYSAKLEAKYMLQDRSFDNLTVEDIATKVGFTTRQSFYASFYKLCGITPKEYRVANGFIPKAELPPPPKPKKKGKKKRSKRLEVRGKR